MSTEPIKIIFASNLQGVIGDSGKLPWSIPEDLALFKEKTLYGTVLMGRKTFDSLPPSIKPLPNRRNIVSTRDPLLKIRGVETVGCPVKFLHKCRKSLWVIGGAEMYNKVMPWVSEVHHTLVHSEADGDTKFHWSSVGWNLFSDTGVLTSCTGVKYQTQVWTYPLLIA